MTVHVLDGGAYRVAPQSAAIPGWKSEEVYRALTEEPWSESTRAALERVSLAMGAREGTTPEDDPHSRSLIRRGEAKSRAEMVRAVLQSRGIELSPELEGNLSLLGDVPAATLIEAAFACAGEADFLRRVRESVR